MNNSVVKAFQRKRNRKPSFLKPIPHYFESIKKKQLLYTRKINQTVLGMMAIVVKQWSLYLYFYYLLYLMFAGGLHSLDQDNPAGVRADCARKSEIEFSPDPNQSERRSCQGPFSDYIMKSRFTYRERTNGKGRSLFLWGPR